MTDPTQGTNPPQQQGQQQYHDDILGGNDIFADIPEADTHEEDLPYGDVLEKKYQFEPIPEMESDLPSQPESIVQEREMPVAETVPPVDTPPSVAVQEIPQKPEEPTITQEDLQDIQDQSSLEQSKVENLLDTKLQTDVQKKFGELYFTVKRIYGFKEKLGQEVEETFDILGADNDKIFVSYRFLLDETSDPMIFITKIEQNKETEEESSNELRFSFNEETSSLEVVVNDVLIFDEIKDLTEDPKKKMQVTEKLNKFNFLASEEQRKLENEIKAKEEEERERKRLQEIFRNF